MLSFLSLYNFSFFVKNQVFIVCGLISGSLICFHWFSLPIPSCFHYYGFLVEFEVRDGNTSRSSFVVQDCIGFLLLFSHMKLSIVLSKSVKNFDGYCIDSVDCF